MRVRGVAERLPTGDKASMCGSAGQESACGGVGGASLGRGGAEGEEPKDSPTAWLKRESTLLSGKQSIKEALRSSTSTALLF